MIKKTGWSQRGCVKEFKVSPKFEMKPCVNNLTWPEIAKMELAKSKWEGFVLLPSDAQTAVWCEGTDPVLLYTTHENFDSAISTLEEVYGFDFWPEFFRKFNDLESPHALDVRDWTEEEVWFSKLRLRD